LTGKTIHGHRQTSYDDDGDDTIKDDGSLGIMRRPIQNQVKPAKLCWLPGLVNEPRRGEKLGVHVHAIAKARPVMAVFVYV